MENIENNEKKNKFSFMPVFIVSFILLVACIGCIVANISGIFSDKDKYGNEEVKVTPKENFTYLVNKSDVTIITFNNDASVVAVPREIDEKSVVKIEEEAFMENNSLYKVYIPDTVEKIGDKAFYYCLNLQYAYIPSSVTEIGLNSFMGNGDKFTIYGEENSYAQEYCETHNIQFIVVK